MTFVNEYVSEENIKNYRLNELWLARNPAYKEVPPSYQHYWTNDKERNIYLQEVRFGNPAFGDDSGQHFILDWNGKQIEFALKKGLGSSTKLTEVPFVIVWETAKVIHPMDLYQIQSNTVIEVLKEALTAYGSGGVGNKYAPNFVVKFNF